MVPTKSRSQRKAAFEQAASAMYDRLEAWYDAHPDASFEEIEAEVRQQRRGLMGDMLATLIVGRDSGQRASAPPCQQCGQPLVFEGYRPWTVKGLEGDTVLERAYYVCAVCTGQTFSPSGSEAAVAGGSLERWGGACGYPAGLAEQVVRSGGDGLWGCRGARHLGR